MTTGRSTSRPLEIGGPAVHPTALEHEGPRAQTEVRHLRSGPVFEIDRQTLINNKTIRDTATHAPDKLVSLEQAETWAFLVVNGCDQIVTVQMLGNITGSLEGTSTLGAAQTVAANTRACFSVASRELWLPWGAMRASYATAPTAGSLTILVAVRNRL